MTDPAKPLDTSAAEAYEQCLVAPLNAIPTQEAVDLSMPRPGERVLDLACGTGIAVRIVAPRIAPGGAVAGVDFDPAMLAVAQRTVHGIDKVDMTWHCASAHDMPFEDAAFDLACCIQGLQYFPDAAAAATEIRRVVKPGGRFVSVLWHRLEDCKGQHALAQALEKRGIDASSTRKAYSMGDPDRVRQLVSSAGFAEIESHLRTTAARFRSARHFVDSFATGSPSSRAAIARIPDDQRTGFYDEISAALRPYEDQGGLALPLGYLITVARS